MTRKRRLTKEDIDYFMADPWAKEHIIIDTTYYTPPDARQPQPGTSEPEEKTE